MIRQRDLKMWEEIGKPLSFFFAKLSEIKNINLKLFSVY